MVTNTTSTTTVAIFSFRLSLAGGRGAFSFSRAILSSSRRSSSVAARGA